MSFIGTAGWNIPAPHKTSFSDKGSHLERYAARLNGVEINSSFYRSHKRTTYEKWALAVPGSFRFSVNTPRVITQDRRLRDSEGLLDQFLEEISGLGDKLGVVLVQLPPSLIYDPAMAKSFFCQLTRAGIAVACEPRHPSWFTPQVEDALKTLNVARVAADPPRAPTDGTPGGDTTFAYFRLHGSPEIYYSSYSQTMLTQLAVNLRTNDWCIFDNTAEFHALGNALLLHELIYPLGF